MYAQHLELDQRVAVKFLLDDLSGQEEGAERFRREARAAAKIQSDHVVRVLDVGVLPTGERYMVMEYLEGRDLAEELADKKRFSVGVAAGFILEAIDAVSQAHAVGIVHRDLKPANLFLARRRDGGQRIKVLDFGISKAIGAATTPELSLTKTSAWIGSPLYMAPEQMESARDVDQRADLWSLGAILYELVSGRTPYVADSLPHLCNLLITQDPEPVQRLRPDLPFPIAEAIMDCLRRNPKERTSSALELARALAPYATSITGSSMRASVLMRLDSSPRTIPTEREEDAQLFPSDEITGRKSAPDMMTVRSNQDSSQGGTKVAWGGTDPDGQKRRTSRWPLLALALMGGTALAFYLYRAESNDRESHLVESAMKPVVAMESPQVVEPTLESEAVGTEIKELRPEGEGPPPSNARPKTETAAAPAPRPRTRPVVRPSNPQPDPEPASQPEVPRKSKDEFSDFGGRR
jgi:serine/threonine-protein kinase